MSYGNTASAVQGKCAAHTRKRVRSSSHLRHLSLALDGQQLRHLALQCLVVAGLPLLQQRGRSRRSSESVVAGAGGVCSSATRNGAHGTVTENICEERIGGSELLRGCFESFLMALRLGGLTDSSGLIPARAVARRQRRGGNVHTARASLPASASPNNHGCPLQRKCKPCKHNQRRRHQPTQHPAGRRDHLPMPGQCAR